VYPGDSSDHLRFDPQTIVQDMPNFSTTHKLLARAELAASIGGNPVTGTSPGGLPEQKIFPGIVHETVRKESLLGQTARNE
jgi:hypothetical protein